jgi:dihydrofolate reductase
VKVTIFMAITANGFIAKEDDDTSFISMADWKRFLAKTREVGNCIMGRRTFEICVKEGVFPFKGCLNVVATRRRIKNRWGSNVVFAKSPEQITKLLKSKGFAEALIGGGGDLNSSFIKKGLASEVVVDVQPKLLGSGIPIFSASDFEADLKLVEVKKLSKNEVRLRYKVLK